MPAQNPYEHFPGEDMPDSVLPNTPTADQLVCPKDYRFLIRLERSILLNELRTKLAELSTRYLRPNNGISLFKNYIPEGDLRLLISDREYVARVNSTAIFANLVRLPYYGESGFPDGSVLEAANFFIPKSGRMFSSVHETISRQRQEKGFPKTEFASTLVCRDDRVSVWGGFLADQMPPMAAGTLQGISDFSGQYHHLVGALRFCNDVAFEEYVTTLGIAE